MSAQIIPFPLNLQKRNRLETNLIDQAQIDIAPTIQRVTCGHSAVEWIGFAPMAYKRCRTCKTVLEEK